MTKKLFRKITKERMRKNEDRYYLSIEEFHLDGSKNTEFCINGNSDNKVSKVTFKTYENGLLSETKCVMKRKPDHVKHRHFFYDGSYPILTIENGQILNMIKYNDDKTQGVGYKLENDQLVKHVVINYDSNLDKDGMPVILSNYLVNNPDNIIYEPNGVVDHVDYIVEEDKDGDGDIIRRVIDNPESSFIVEEFYEYYDIAPTKMSEYEMSEFESLMQHGKFCYKQYIYK